NRYFQLRQAIAIGNGFGLHDLSIFNYESKHSAEAAAWRVHQSHCPVDKCWLHKLSQPRKCNGTARPVPRTTNLSRCARHSRCSVRAEYHIRIEHCNQTLEVTGAQRPEKGFNNCSPGLEIGLRHFLRSMHSSASAARKLPCGIRSAIDDRSNLIERQIKYIMQHKSAPFRWRQCIQPDEQRQTY